MEGMASPTRDLSDLILGNLPSVFWSLWGCRGEETFQFW